MTFSPSFGEAIVGTESTGGIDDIDDIVETAFIDAIRSICGNGILGACPLSFLALGLFTVGQSRFRPRR